VQPILVVNTNKALLDQTSSMAYQIENQTILQLHLPFLQLQICPVKV
jgi:hypothetical protein